MAMQSSGATKQGVIQSSIALLQERFRQLQKEKEMRERRQLLRNNNNNTNFISTSPSSDSELGNYYFNINTHNNDHFKLKFSDEVEAVKQAEISLSLWPASGSSENGPVWVKRAEQDYNGRFGYLGLDVKCDDSHLSDVDTSLHL